MQLAAGLQRGGLLQGDPVDDGAPTQGAQGEWLGTLHAATHVAAVEEQYERLQQQQYTVGMTHCNNNTVGMTHCNNTVGMTHCNNNTVGMTGCNNTDSIRDCNNNNIDDRWNERLQQHSWHERLQQQQQQQQQQQHSWHERLQQQNIWYETLQ